MSGKYAKGILLLLCPMLLTGGCEIKPDSASEGVYSTQMPMSALEYSIYMSKQITTFASQITGRTIAVKTAVETGKTEDPAIVSESIKIMKDILEEVTVTRPAKTADDDRLTTISAMETAISNMEDYRSALVAGEDISSYADTFSVDYNSITGLSSLYYQ